MAILFFFKNQSVFIITIMECLCLFVSYNSIHLPGPLCTKCISSFILNTPLPFPLVLLLLLQFQ